MSSSQQRIVAEVDAWHHVCGAESDLLGFSEEVVRVAVQHHSTHRPHRHEFFGDQLGGVEHIEAEGLGLFFAEQLQTEFPLGVLARLDGFPQVTTVKVRIGSRNLHGLVPHQRMRAELGLPMKLHELGRAFGSDEAKGVHAKALHHAKTARDGAVGHHPHKHVRRLGRQRDEVPESIVRRSRLRHCVVRLGLYRVHQIGKLHRILDEEDRHVVADQIPGALIGIELDGKAAHIACRVDRASFASHGGKAHEHRRDLAGLRKRRGASDVGECFVGFEVAVRRRAACVNDALWNSLVVEVGDLLAQDEVFQQGGPTQPGLQRVLVVGNRHTLVGREHLVRAVDTNLHQPTVAGMSTGRRRLAGFASDVQFAHGAGRHRVRRRLCGEAHWWAQRVLVAEIECLVGVVRHGSHQCLRARGLLHHKFCSH